MPSTRTAARSAAEPVIRVGGAAALFPLVARHGVDPHALAAEAGLSVDFFANPDNVVPFAALCRLTQLAAQRTGLGDIGLRACARMGLPALGLLGYLVAHSESVERPRGPAGVPVRSRSGRHALCQSRRRLGRPGL